MHDLRRNANEKSPGDVSGAFCLSMRSRMIRKSVQRLSGEIMRKQKEPQF
jgi:hypothetical protein